MKTKTQILHIAGGFFYIYRDDDSFGTYPHYLLCKKYVKTILGKLPAKISITASSSKIKNSIRYEFCEGYQIGDWETKETENSPFKRRTILLGLGCFLELPKFHDKIRFKKKYVRYVRIEEITENCDYEYSIC